MKMSSLQATIEKIKQLETEKQNLLAEIGELRKMADAKAMSLETEVAALREEAQTLKVLMTPEPTNVSVNPIKIN